MFLMRMWRFAEAERSAELTRALLHGPPKPRAEGVVPVS